MRLSGLVEPFRAMFAGVRDVLVGVGRRLRRSGGERDDDLPVPPDRLGRLHLLISAVSTVGAYWLFGASMDVTSHITVLAVVLLVLPAYLALYWLIYARQKERDDVDDATRRSIAAYRRATTTKETAEALRGAVEALTAHLEGHEDPNAPKGRHHR